MTLTFDLERYEDGRWFAFIVVGRRALSGQGESVWEALADAVRGNDVARVIADEYASLAASQRRTLSEARRLLDDVRAAAAPGDVQAARKISLQALRLRRNVDGANRG